MRLTKILLTCAILATLSTEAMAAPVCTRSDVNALRSAERSLKASLNRFENSKIKTFCSSGRKLLSDYHRFAQVIKARSRCTLATSRDRRSWSKVTSAMARAEREFRQSCR